MFDADEGLDKTFQLKKFDGNVVPACATSDSGYRLKRTWQDPLDPIPASGGPMTFDATNLQLTFSGTNLFIVNG